MEEGMYIKGVVILEPMDDKEISAGTMGVVDTSSGLDIVTVEHITQDGFWWVDGNIITGELSAETNLNKILVLAGDKSYPLKFAHWKKVIQHNLFEDKGVYQFLIVPLKFKKGKYSIECVKCTSYFIGGKGQSLCKECCYEDSFALFKYLSLIHRSEPTRRTPR